MKTVDISLKFEWNVELGSMSLVMLFPIYVGNVDKRWLVTSYIFTLARTLVNSKSTLQSTIILSIEAKHLVVIEAVKEAI